MTSDYVFTTYPLATDRLPVSDVTFATNRKNLDRYSVRVRNDWTMEAHYQLAATLLKAGDWFIDAGANIGTFAFPVARITGAYGLLAEALPANCDLLRAACPRNPGADVRIVNAAVGRQRGEIFISGSSAYAKTNQDDVGDRIRMLPLSDLVEQAPGGEVALIKMDIEGSELDAFLGAEALLKSKRVPNIIFESNGPVSVENGYSVRDLRKVLSRNGYALYTIVGHTLVPTGDDDFQFAGNTDILASSEPVSRIGKFRVGDLAEDRIIAFVVRALTTMPPQYRTFMLAELAYAPAWVVDHNQVASLLDDVSVKGADPAAI